MHQQAGFDVRSSDVIYGGVSPSHFFFRRVPADYAGGPLRLLYAGYIDVRRGLHTIVEALGLIPAAQRDSLHLSVAHAGPIVRRRIRDRHSPRGSPNLVCPNTSPSSAACLTTKCRAFMPRMTSWCFPAPGTKACRW